VIPHAGALPPPGKHVLIVEDDEGNRLTLSALLEEAGFHVDEAASLAQARQALCAGRFALVVLDVMLGDGSGMDLVSDVKERQPGTRIALYTGSPRQAPPGVDLVILKGSDPFEVLEEIERLGR
jgi:DNA-binding NtrC family response regulator